MLIPAGKAIQPNGMDVETSATPLRKRVGRIKARWLQRVMYSEARQIEKNFAYVIFDYLNCVTRDAWPSQGTIAKRLRCSTKTVQRAGEGLEQRQLIAILRSRKRGVGHRYAPIFTAEDLDNFDLSNGQSRPDVADTSVQQSSSSIHFISTSISRHVNGTSRYPSSNYRPAERGKWEAELAKRLGSEGMDLLGKLASIDDRIVADLCRALCDGELGPRELEAARLAARQAWMKA